MGDHGRPDPFPVVLDALRLAASQCSALGLDVHGDEFREVLAELMLGRLTIERQPERAT